MPDPLVTVVVPTHNSPDTLRLAIDSALRQTFEDFELLVVGDGCTDDTADVVRSYGDARIEWLDLPKAPGIGYANRNVALRQAVGELIAYLAHDDLWVSDHLELMVATIRSRSVDFAYSRVVMVDPCGNLWPTTFNLEAPATRRGLKPTDLNLGIGSVIHRRGLLDRFGYWDETGRAGGDHRLWFRFYSGLGPGGVAFVPQPTSLHFVAKWRKAGRRWYRPHRDSVFKKTGVYRELLPDVLRVAVPKGTSEQAAVAAAMEDPDWNEEMRRAVIAVLDARLERVDDGLSLMLGAAARRLYRLAAIPYRRATIRQIDDLGAAPSEPEESDDGRFVQ